MIIGIDEVGRGSLAGPVVLASTMINPDFPRLTSFFETTISNWYTQNPDFKIIRDSKKLSLKQRENISILVDNSQLKNIILASSSNLIDQFGIGVCLSHMVLLSLHILTKNQKITEIIVDGKIKILAEINPILSQQIINENNLEIDLSHFTEFVATQKLPINRENFADDKYLSVAIASNIAKVFRDNLMIKLDLDFPEFNWSTNKGYGTIVHRKAIINCKGKNPHLRQSFLTRILID